VQKLHFEFFDISNRTGEDVVLNNHYVCSEVAESLCAVGNFTMALQLFETLKLIPENCTANLYTQIGTCYLAQDEDIAAEDCFQRAADLDQNNTEARGHLANLFRKQGKQKQALDMANHVVQLIQIQNASKPRRKYDKLYRDLVLSPGGNTTPYVRNLLPLQPKPVNGELREQTPMIAMGKIVAQPMAKPILTPEDRLLAEAQASKTLATHFLILGRERERMRAGVFPSIRLWVKAARALTNDFRSFKAFYPQDKSLKFSGYSATDIRQASTPLRDDMRALASQLSQGMFHTCLPNTCTYC
jgi:general transcription factor 3C polypeptide 3 (transcription factor C subunit 4)